ncbi:MAG: hypothetical protein AAGB24_14665 [Bacteroidota bacterium]
MDKVDRVEFKDEILKLVRESGRCNKRDVSSLFSQDAKGEYFEDIFKELVDSNLINVTSRTKDSTRIEITYQGKELLDLGGFTKQYELEVEKIKEGIQKKREDNKLQELQKENLQLINRLNKQKLKTHWIPIIISLFGLVIALASYFKPSKEISKPIDNSRFNNIEMKMEQLENGLKKDLDSIQNELYEAQMLIDSHES